MVVVVVDCVGYYMNLNQNPRTLLPKFFGLYCYQCNSKNVRLVIMNNLLPSAVTLHMKYDLKGSTYKRKVHTHPIPHRTWYTPHYICTYCLSYRHPKVKDRSARPHTKIWTLWNTTRRVYCWRQIRITPSSRLSSGIAECWRVSRSWTIVY